MSSIEPVYVPGNRTIHAGKPNGRYPSGAQRWRKLCGSTSRYERHEPVRALFGGALVGPEITCKRCLAKMGG